MDDGIAKHFGTMEKASGTDFAASRKKKTHQHCGLEEK
jgi:hypothetical protein